MAMPDAGALRLSDTTLHHLAPLVQRPTYNRADVATGLASPPT